MPIYISKYSFSNIPCPFLVLSGKNDGPQVVLISNLHNEKFTKKFWVIGSDNIDPKPDKPFSGAGVRSKKSLEWSQGFRKQRHQATVGWRAFTENVIPNGANSVIVVVLLKLQSQGILSKEWKTEKLFTKQHPAVPLEEIHIDEIAKSLVDMVVFSKGARTDRCNFAERLAPLLQNRKYLLREYEQGGMVDRSLSRCPQIFEQNIPFLANRFRLSAPTPGAENSCSEGADPFIIEAILQSQAAQREDDMEQPHTSQNLDLPQACGEPHHMQEILAEQDFHVTETFVEGLEDDVTLTGEVVAQTSADEVMSETLTIDIVDSFQTVKNCDNTIVYKRNIDSTKRTSKITMSQLFPQCSLQEESSAESTVTAESSAESSAPAESSAEAEPDDQGPAPKKRKCSVSSNPSLVSAYCGIQQEDVSRLSNPFYKQPDTKRFFKAEWANFISRNPKLIKGETHELEQWKEFLAFHIINDGAALMYCRYCLHNTQDMYSGSNRWTRLANPLKFPGGFPLTQEKKENHKFIRRHMISNQHKTIREALIQRRKQPIAVAFEVQAKKLQAANTDRLAMTANMMRTVYAEIILNIPFNSHPKVMKLMEMNSAMVGIAHRSRFSATSVLEFIGNRFQNRLIKHIKDSNTPMSLMWDTATDKTDRQFLLVYIRALEDNYPHVYFFRLIELGISSTAATQFQSIITALATEGLAPTIKQHLYGLGADGTAVNTGQRNGIMAKLREYTDHEKTIAVWCLAHKVELAVKHAFEEFQFYENFDATMNNLYYFFHCKSSKRISALKETAAVINQKYTEIRHLFHSRFVPSEVRSMESILKMWDPLVTTLLEIANNRGIWGVAAANTATGLLQHFRHPDFLANFNFKLDMLQIFKRESLSLQSKTGTIIGKINFRERLVEKLLPWKEDPVPGGYTNAFLNEAKCSQITDVPEGDTEACTTVENFEQAKTIYYKGALLKFGPRRSGNRRQGQTTEERENKLSELRAPVVNNLVQQVQRYFDHENILNAFNVFDPSKLPDTVREAQTHGTDNLRQLATYYEENVATLQLQWKEALSSIITDSTFPALKASKDPVSFWYHYLKDRNQVVDWQSKQQLQKIIQISLILPAASADVERGFSYLKYMKYDRRSSLLASTVDSMMQLKVNGPPLETFDAQYYANFWLREGHYSSDTDTTRKEKGRTESSDFDIEESKKAYLRNSALF